MKIEGKRPSAQFVVTDAKSTLEDNSSQLACSSRKQLSPCQLRLKSASRNTLSLLRDIFTKALLFLLVDEEGIVVENCFQSGYSFYPTSFSCESLTELDKTVLTQTFSDGSGNEAKFLYSKLVDSENFFYGYLLVAFYTNDIDQVDNQLLKRFASIVSNTCQQQRYRFLTSELFEGVALPWLIINDEGRIINGQSGFKRKIGVINNIYELLPEDYANILENETGSFFAHININNITEDYEIIYNQVYNNIYSKIVIN